MILLSLHLLFTITYYLNFLLILLGIFYLFLIQPLELLSYLNCQTFVFFLGILIYLVYLSFFIKRLNHAIFANKWIIFWNFSSFSSHTPFQSSYSIQYLNYIRSSLSSNHSRCNIYNVLIKILWFPIN